MKRLALICFFVVACAANTTEIAPSEPLAIVEVLANPAGADAGQETVTLQNNGKSSISTTDYALRSLRGNQVHNVSDFAATLTAGQRVTVQPRVGVAWLNNEGDTLLLLKAGKEIQRVQWAVAQEAVPIKP